ncbi:MAG TPA: hypothetical protein VFO10_27215 [Oligoflexus sp.]|uniref:hypothetical protein n=1 Tax=Oligoflexus sp. TaxID=1971216 RepID=UPI002D7EF4A6|nr:hypothetical protein [Oligoflexus sp.]HET9240986.1 hypothetical protein [Oligoflexus sp.]
MRPLWTMGLLLATSFSGKIFAAKAVTIDVTVHWEGRELHAPNVDALERMRKTFPDIPLTHFVNPAYFLDEAKAADNLNAMQRVFGTQDEVGLYLAPVENLVQEAGVILKLAPSFWGYADEGEICENDCGLDVPLTVYTREETLRILSAAHRTLIQAGFSSLKSFTVRGWMEAPFLTQLAGSFGYRFDLSPVDPELVAPKLREFPLSAWVAERWSMLVQPDAKALQALAGSHPLVLPVPQRGGIMELNEQREILARFDKQLKEGREDEVFTLALSAEAAFQSWPKLRMVLQSLQEKAKKQGITLRFTTVSGVKNSRPTAANMRISHRFSRQAEARK